MKKINKPLFILLLLIAMIIAIPSTCKGAETSVNLRSASNFAVLAGSTITNTGASKITGDVGLYPGTSYTGSASVIMNGTVYLANTVASVAKTDLTTAYNDAAGRSNVTRISTELGGSILTPGVYDSADGKFQITGTLTLDAQGDPNAVFIFKTASTLITAVGSDINLINDATSCQVFWKVGSSATLGANSNFVGSILALTSITANNSANIEGQLLARNGAVTLENNTITKAICQDIQLPAILHVIVNVINDNGGTAVVNDFTVYVKTSGNDVDTSPLQGVSSPGTTYNLPASTYVVTQDIFTGYTTTYTGDSDSSGNVILLPGDEKTVIITNNDNPVETTPVVIPSTTVEDELPKTIEGELPKIVVIANNDNPVGTTPVVITSTVVGGQLPKTGSNIYIIAILGTILILVGITGVVIIKRYE